VARSSALATIAATVWFTSFEMDAATVASALIRVTRASSGLGLIEFGCSLLNSFFDSA
jgi:hypothetical protein